MYSSGTDEYITQVVERYSSMLLHLAMTRVNCAADAEDVVQEVFLKLLTAQPRFRDGDHERAWLIRATINRACDLRRAAASQDLPLEEAGEKAAPDVQMPELLSAVQALPEKYSTVIHLYYYEGYNIWEIAKLLGLPAATVGTRLARGRSRLKELLKEEEVWTVTNTAPPLTK